MFRDPEVIQWSSLARPYGRAERVLGRLACALDATTLHHTWLWREITRVSVIIAQANGYHARVDQLRLTLIGAPIEREQKTPGLAAAKRVFLASAPLFRKRHYADSLSTPWPSYWHGDGADDEIPERRGDEQATKEGLEHARLAELVRDLSAFAEDGQRPALINLLIDLKSHAGTKTLPPTLTRIAMPLALVEAGLVPKAAPGLLGGRRLPLGFSRAAPTEKPLTDWLKDALEELAKGIGSVLSATSRAYPPARSLAWCFG